jgi:hypothetical protein
MSQFYGYKFCYEKQPIATLDQAPPVQNTWYTVLDTVKAGRLVYLSMKHDNTDNSALTINMRVTIDGVVLTAAADAAGTDNTAYYFYVDPTADALLSTTTVFNAGYYEDLRGNSIKVEVRMTGVPGTAEHLYGYVQYELWKPTG